MRWFDNEIFYTSTGNAVSTNTLPTLTSPELELVKRRKENVWIRNMFLQSCWAKHAKVSRVCVRGVEEVAHFPDVNISEVAHREFLVRSSA